jgi:hypothetical protein
MTFMGDDLAISAQFQADVIKEVLSLGKYIPERISAEQVPESLSFPPDRPPDPVYLRNTNYVLTGEYYVDVDDLEHFQLWLWNSGSGALVYTDEMVFEDAEEAGTYLPPMVKWIFSHTAEERIVIIEESISAEKITPVQEAAPAADTGTTLPRNRFFTGQFYLGMRGGLAFAAYSSLVSGGYEAGMSQGFSANGAVVAEYQIFSFLGLQAEVIFNYDTFKVTKITEISPTYVIRSSDRFKVMSMMFPLLIKVPLKIGVFSLSPYIGAYYTLPIGTVKMVPGDSSVSPAASFGYVVRPPVGLLLGIDSGLALGPGELFIDLRFSRDAGITIVARGQGIQYIRNQINLSLGYKLLLSKPRRLGL